MKKEKYVIEKDPILKMWIVFENLGSLKMDRFKSKKKKECTKWKEKQLEKQQK